MSATHRLTHSLPNTLVLASALALMGCGGGGSDITTPSPAVVTALHGTLSGSAVKGPVIAATVTAYAISQGSQGAQLASTSTDAHGAFTLDMGSYAGSVMLELQGGHYVDEATELDMPMQAADRMTAVLPAMAAGTPITGVQITPLTSMAQAWASHMTGGMSPANNDLANAALGSYFMVPDILHTSPMDPLTPGSAAAATQAMKSYGMLLAAMSQYARNAGMTASSGMVSAMMQDASDGVLDGRAGGSPVAMGGGMMSGNMMPMDLGRAGLANAMNDFMNSKLNRSGMPAADMAALMQQMRTSDGHMH